MPVKLGAPHASRPANPACCWSVEPLAVGGWLALVGVASAARVLPVLSRRGGPHKMQLRTNGDIAGPVHVHAEVTTCTISGRRLRPRKPTQPRRLPLCCRERLPGHQTELELLVDLRRAPPGPTVPICRTNISADTYTMSHHNMSADIFDKISSTVAGQATRSSWRGRGATARRCRTR